MADYVGQMQRFRPRVLLGYASALAALAQFVEACEVRDIHLDAVISSAETLFAEQRQKIEKALGCRVYDRYGCREGGPLAVECAKGQMHVSADYVYLELLCNGQPARPGEMGEIVITPLYSYGMPLIRYRTGDLGIAAEQISCACGRNLPILKRVIGRTSDILSNRRGDLFHGEYFTHLFYDRRGVRQFQVVQTDPESLVFKVVTDKDFDARLLQDIEASILAFMGPMHISWEQVDQIPPLRSGKRSFTISHVPIQLGTAALRRPTQQGQQR